MFGNSRKKYFIDYFAKELWSKTNMTPQDAQGLIVDVITEELRTAKDRGLERLDLPLGDIMLGRSAPPNQHIGNYVANIRSTDKLRWMAEGVTDVEIKEWWDMGGIMHGCYVAFDNFFLGAQFVDAMQSITTCNSMEELQDAATNHVRKNFPMYGPSNGADLDQDEMDRRIPQEMRLWCDKWALAQRTTTPELLRTKMDQSSSFNALLRSTRQTLN